MQKALLVAGLLLVVLALAWPWLGKLPIGRLPGDFFIDRPGFKFYFPFATMLVVSALVSLLLWWFRK